MMYKTDQLSVKKLEGSPRLWKFVEAAITATVPSKSMYVDSISENPLLFMIRYTVVIKIIKSMGKNVNEAENFN